VGRDDGAIGAGVVRKLGAGAGIGAAATTIGDGRGSMSPAALAARVGAIPSLIGSIGGVWPPRSPAGVVGSMAPQCWQNAKPDWVRPPQRRQVWSSPARLPGTGVGMGAGPACGGRVASGDPHRRQKFMPAWFSPPHTVHGTRPGNPEGGGGVELAAPAPGPDTPTRTPGPAPVTGIAPGGTLASLTPQLRQKIAPCGLSRPQFEQRDIE
jgi:hypothetical protein